MRPMLIESLASDSLGVSFEPGKKRDRSHIP